MERSSAMEDDPGNLTYNFKLQMPHSCAWRATRGGQNFCRGCSWRASQHDHYGPNSTTSNERLAFRGHADCGSRHNHMHSKDSIDYWQWLFLPSIIYHHDEDDVFSLPPVPCLYLIARPGCVFGKHSWEFSQRRWSKKCSIIITSSSRSRSQRQQ